MKNLKRLWLDDTAKVTDGGVTELKKTLPALTIMR